MRIGVPKEIKNHEYRVALTPAGAAALRGRGHEVRVQTNAGGHAGFTDDDYVAAGATVVVSAAEAWDADLVIKVKEPQSAELGFFRRDQVLFTYLHLVTCPDVVDAMRTAGSVGIAYETVTNAAGGLPLLIPMSEVAGRLAIQVGAWALMLPQGGSGVCLPGVPGVPPGVVTILGAGTVGTQAARTAMGFGADVTIMDVNLDRLRALDDLYGPRLKTCFSEPRAIARHIAASDLVVGAVLVRGRHAPQLITREMLRAMRHGSVLVDVGIDQGRLRRDLAPDDPRGSDLRRGRRRALLRRQHAGRRRADVDARADTGHAAVRARARRSRMARGMRAATPACCRGSRSGTAASRTRHSPTISACRACRRRTRSQDDRSPPVRCGGTCAAPDLHRRGDLERGQRARCGPRRDDRPHGLGHCVPGYCRSDDRNLAADPRYPGKSRSGRISRDFP
jgi:alanine dehydrogenase